jgi:hypothetical protein
MDGKGRCRDNIFVERLWRTVKYEEVYLHAHQNLVDAREHLRRYFASTTTIGPTRRTVVCRRQRRMTRL